MPLVSVILPAYNGEKFIAQTIQSVLKQTFTDFELLVIDDGSKDDTVAVVKRFQDPRLRLITCSENGGADAARLAGLHQSGGEIIAFLDQDDLFHPQKLLAHVGFLDANPAVGLSYNSRFSIEGAANQILNVWRPPQPLTLADLIFDYPFAPSDTVLRRRWAFLDEIWDNSFVEQGEEIIVNGGEIVFCGRLWLSGCQFGFVDRALNYRRLHPERILSDLRQRCRSELKCQDIILRDPRCPRDLEDHRGRAAANIYLSFAAHAYFQNDLTLGREFLTRAVEQHPLLLEGDPPPVIDYFATSLSAFNGIDHVDITHRFFNALPSHLKKLARYEEWTTAYGYLLKGTRIMLWQDLSAGEKYFQKAISSGLSIDKEYLNHLSYELSNYEFEFGRRQATARLSTIVTHLKPLDHHRHLPYLQSQFALDRAFRKFTHGQVRGVVRDIVTAIIHNPQHLKNRGVWSIFMRSLLHFDGQLPGHTS